MSTATNFKLTDENGLRTASAFKSGYHEEYRSDDDNRLLILFDLEENLYRAVGMLNGSFYETVSSSLSLMRKLTAPVVEAIEMKKKMDALSSGPSFRL